MRHRLYQSKIAGLGGNILFVDQHVAGRHSGCQQARDYVFGPEILSNSVMVHSKWKCLREWFFVELVSWKNF